MRQNPSAPEKTRKHPETFCLTFLLRTSRWAKLLPFGNREVMQKPQNGFLTLFQAGKQVAGGTLFDPAAPFDLGRKRRRVGFPAAREQTAILFLELGFAQGGETVRSFGFDDCLMHLRQK